ncbi:hypothetical protein VTK73DRAFT_6158 [Phialemonium thermophilum]|uniref:Rhodopsin domain-containing protein n=1 Tax=Phialemonium thermophilum TaxID=223376 RepID=A0ABR3V058_9PEZI
MSAGRDGGNPAWDYAGVLVWSAVECDVAVAVACLPAVRALVNRLRRRTTGVASGGGAGVPRGPARTSAAAAVAGGSGSSSGKKLVLDSGGPSSDPGSSREEKTAPIPPGPVGDWVSPECGLEMAVTKLKSSEMGGEPADDLSFPAHVRVWNGSGHRIGA